MWKNFLGSFHKCGKEVGEKQTLIVTVFRDGPVYDEMPRFCKVYCKNIDAKVHFINFINSSRKLNTDGFSKLRARPDLSYLQRQRARELRSELQIHIDAGENDFFIDYKNNCVKRRRRVI